MGRIAPISSDPRSPAARSVRHPVPRLRIVMAEEERRHILPPWSSAAALVAVLALAWVNFLTTARWAAEPGALHGWRKPWYGLALGAVTVLALATGRRIGQPIAAAAVGRPGLPRRRSRCSDGVLVRPPAALLVDRDPVQGRLDAAVPARGEWRQPAAAWHRRRMELVAARWLPHVHRHRAELRHRSASSR